LISSDNVTECERDCTGVYGGIGNEHFVPTFFPAPTPQKVYP
jgi:hypothetical protein